MLTPPVHREVQSSPNGLAETNFWIMKNSKKDHLVQKDIKNSRLGSSEPGYAQAMPGWTKVSSKKHPEDVIPSGWDATGRTW